MNSVKEPARFVYVHVPFCEQHCTFCDFFTITDAANGAARAAKWFDLIRREMRLWKEVGDLDAAVPLEAIYFGGGTPSLTRASTMADFLQYVKEEFALAPVAEISIEMQPGTADNAKLEAYTVAGVNRFSVGVQTFDPSILEVSGRRHTVEDTRAMLGAMNQLRLNFSIDLINAWPGQALDAWRRELDEALSWSAPHYSVYELTFKPGTEMHRQVRRGELTETDEETRLAMFDETDRVLSAAGYEHYEVSNYARPGARSRHNENYWKLGNFAGLGAGAHSFIFPHRYVNANSAHDYEQAVSAGRLFRRESDTPDHMMFMLENLQMGLRLLEGVDLDRFAERFETDLRTTRGDKLAQIVEAGFAEMNGSMLKLTSTGRVRIDALSAHLL